MSSEHNSDNSVFYCQVCGVICEISCTLCQNAYYCSEEHQKLDWTSHKPTCQPIRTEQNERIGPHWVAGRDIKMGEVIFKEECLFVAPWFDSTEGIFFPICLGCCNFITKPPSYLCSSCGWPVCDMICEKKIAHASNECKIFTQLKIQPKHTNAHTDLYHPISVLRLLLLSTFNRERANKIEAIRNRSASELFRFKRLRMSENIDNEMLNQTSQNHERLQGLVKLIQEICQLKEYGEDDIMNADEFIHRYGLHFDDSATITACSIYGFKNRSAVVLCEKANLLNHSCGPNSRHTIDEEGSTFMMTLYATSNIKTGDKITIPFVETYRLPGNGTPLLYLKNNFLCACGRCLDPTSGTYCAVKCPDCETGYLFPKEFLCQLPSVWKCNGNAGCDEKPNAQILQILTPILAELSQFQFSKISCSDEFVIVLLQLLRKHSGVTLHPNHEYMNLLRFQLSQVMFNLSVLTSQHSRVMLLLICKRAAMITLECYQITNKMLPGWNNYRGLLLHQLAHLTYQISRISSEPDIQNSDGKSMALELLEIVQLEYNQYKDVVVHLGNFERLFFDFKFVHIYRVCSHVYRYKGWLAELIEKMEAPGSNNLYLTNTL